MNLALFVPLLTLFLHALAGIVLAAPLPLERIANDATMECALFLPGDECMDCTPPSGWRVLGRDVSYPANYSIVSIDGICRGFENSRCCTEGHTGASGECSNLVRNDLSKECALVEDAINYTLPVGWIRKPASSISLSKWLCPLAYNWTSQLTVPVSNPAGKIFVIAARESEFLIDNTPASPNQWNWITNTNTEASWTFYNLPMNTDIHLYLTPLVTNKLNGGSGYSTDADISYETRSGSFQIRTVPLFNPQMQYATDSQGWGYQAYGLLEIPGNQIRSDGRMAVKLNIRQWRTEHVAVSNNCCVAEWHY
ncbi:MAG: hypothetical protein MUO26_08395 [Methanotrichaceae archaeon]|nr:hypothetical protein [Methanotrichaceae archaeon]